MTTNDESQEFTERGAAFQKIWLQSMSKLMQAACTFSPNSAPPELMREIRNGVLQALAESWNEFLRSPQFQENMKQWMDNAIAFRKMSNDFMSRVRKEMQAPSRDDVDAILLTVRHMETRILDRIETLSKEVETLKQKSAVAKSPENKPAAPKVPRKSARARKARTTCSR